MPVIRAAACLLACCLAAPLAAQTGPAPATAAPQGPPLPACTAPEFRQFDFWVGHWDVYPTGSDQLVAHSLIENLYAGCAIRENWMPLPGQGDAGGGSLNVYRPAEHRWRQTWTDSSNSLVDFYGGVEGGKMVLTGTRPGQGGAEYLVRIEFTPNADGSVRQVGTRSADHGRTWQPRYDFTYRPSR